jgi:hypothetical protein
LSKLLRALREPTKLFNSLRLSARATGTRFRELPVVAASNCRIERHRTARLEIDGRLYLGCFVPAVGRIAARSAATEIRLAESAVMRCDGVVQLGPGVRVTVGPHARVVIGDGPEPVDVFAVDRQGFPARREDAYRPALTQHELRELDAE